MSKPFDYSKWDNIELSDDEEDCHPNIDKESWFRMKHRSRVEREGNEAKDKAAVQQEMDKAAQRIKVLEHDLAKMKMTSKDGDSDSDDDDLDDREGLEAELDELQKQNTARQAKLDEYEKNKKWNIDNMFHVTEERTMVNPAAAKANYTETGFAVSTEDLVKDTTAATTDDSKPAPQKVSKETTAARQMEAKAVVVPSSAAAEASKPAPLSKPAPTKQPALAVGPVKADVGAIETYPEFTQKYADIVEEFMAIPDLEGSKAFLLKHGDILLQENASNYLLLASLEDEMNGHREKMKQTARQSQIISHIAELAKTMHTHPGNVIQPFFQRLQTREYLQEFVTAVKAFCDKIIQRAVTKKQEMDAARRAKEGSTDLADIPREDRLGPGGLDPLEVIETLPAEMVAAFETRDVEQLKEALMKLDPADAEYHMKRCIDSGLWVANA